MSVEAISPDIKATQQQQEVPEPPLAIVNGEPVLDLPDDLYIPPDALEVLLETFEGPLDLLLYLIKRKNLDILNIPIAEITRQYIGYINLMQVLRIELAADYLLMAAMLAEIKSRLLLPRVGDDEEDEDDPRAELIRRLQEYEAFRNAASDLEELPRMQRDTFQVNVATDHISAIKREPSVELEQVLLAFQDVLRRMDQSAHHQIMLEPLSVRDRMSSILEHLKHGSLLPFISLFDSREGRSGIVVSFLAILELAREGLVEIIQSEPFSEIQVRSRAA
ncbi:MAG TPA: segregation/condensation protein A [Crenotrichaceae bacterium]|nr:segregation/condensation protein A [Crenotrichaceae bacterium]